MSPSLRPLLILLLVGLGLCAAEPPTPPFEADIRAFVEADRRQPPKRDGILFVGSSIFREWTNVTEMMAPLPVVNRAFGGSRTGHQLARFDQVVTPHAPRVIVYYCGSNDLMAGDDPNAIFGRFREFSERVRQTLPSTHLIYVTATRSPDRVAKWERVDQYNGLVRAHCAATPRHTFIDINPALVDTNGTPRLDLYRSDRLHFHPHAYAEFARVIRPVLERIWQQASPPADAAGPKLLPIESKVTHGFATNDGVRIHYARLGSGPLVVMIHGFPDCWLTWRDQMEALALDHEVVAIDQRGYNLSDRPAGGSHYDMRLLVLDVAAVIRERGRQKAIIVGHDWGGAVAWNFATTQPGMTERLIVLNLPHPRGLQRELARNPEQQRNSAYARVFQMEGAHTNLTAKGLTFWIKDPVAKARYIEVFERSDFEAMLHYYKRNYPREPYTEDTSPLVQVQCPVLLIHGLKDKALGAAALNESWKVTTRDLTLLTLPNADHWVQQDASAAVTRAMQDWLRRPTQ